VTCSPRTFIVGPDDTLYRLASAKFSRMLADPEHDRLPRFASQRVRMVDAIVELLGLEPKRPQVSSLEPWGDVDDFCLR
jgi:hypothetical protein